ncbi:hypothetical protein ABPG74_005955 [Tetrahymena malaccensis]
MGNTCCGDRTVEKNECNLKEIPKEPIYAICVLQSEDHKVTGKVYFKQEGDKCKIRAEVKGLSKGKHGFHIHEYGNLIDGCKSAGAHFNPTKQTHGAPDSKERHVGDLGNIENTLSEDNVAVYEIIDHLISLYGEYNVIGRSCVIHADEDDLGLGNFEDSKTTGHAGARVACGPIGLCAKFSFDF